MLKYCLTFGLAVVLVTPALALDPYSFTLDQSKSTITITGSGGSTASPLSGTYSMMLGTPSGTHNTRDWDVTAELGSLNIANTQAMAFTHVIYNVQIAAGGFALTDWNQSTPPQTTLAGGPNISSGMITTDAQKYLVTTINGQLQAPDTGWVMMNWDIQVSDDDWLAVAGTGDVESHIYANYTAGNGINYVTNLYGRGTLVPEPSTLSLLALSGLALLRRRRAI